MDALPSSGGTKTLVWTWGEAVDAFLEYKLENLKELWLRQYHKIMKLRAFSSIENSRLDQIDIAILDRVWDDII